MPKSPQDVGISLNKVVTTPTVTYNLTFGTKHRKIEQKMSVFDHLKYLKQHFASMSYHFIRLPCVENVYPANVQVRK